MLIQNEKRDHARLLMGSEANYTYSGQPTRHGCTLRELSATGLSFIAEERVEAGVKLTITINPGKSITPPLVAEVEVLRVTENGGSSYEMACKIHEIMQDDI